MFLLGGACAAVMFLASAMLGALDLLQRYGDVYAAAAFLFFAIAPFAVMNRFQTVVVVEYGRGHCTKCGYCLTGIQSGRCPECGTPIHSSPRAAG
jgi:hypothetical protein